MAQTFGTRFKNAWTAFRKDTLEDVPYMQLGAPSARDMSSRPIRGRLSGVNKDTVIVPIFNQIGIDVSSINIRHVRTDGNGRFLEEVNSELNNCLSLEPNIDQTRSAFFRDAVMSLCELGAIAIVPVESKGNPFVTGGFDPTSLRIGEIVQWYPRHVKVSLYNDQTGRHEERIFPKTMTAIVENPRYAVMNEPNSTLQRLVNKLRLLDVVDEQSSSGKLDIFVQLPYAIKSDMQEDRASKRKKNLEDQLRDSKYGIGYLDATEKITQLNRPAENNLMAQVEYLTNMLYGQLGLTPEIIDGTADEAAMINYHNRTIEPFLSAITESMTRTFLTRTARTQGQRIHFYRDPFKLVPTSVIAEIADKFTRNEIATSNEIRSVIGWRPSDDPKANELRNSNLSAPKGEFESRNNSMDVENGEDGQNGSDSGLSVLIDTLEELVRDLDGSED